MAIQLKTIPEIIKALSEKRTVMAAFQGINCSLEPVNITEEVYNPDAEDLIIELKSYTYEVDDKESENKSESIIEYVPFETMAEIMLHKDRKIKSKSNADVLYKIERAVPQGNKIMINIGNHEFTSEIIFNGFVFEDGTPVGKSRRTSI